jgi:hypothetical protein
MVFNVTIDRDEDGVFVVECPSIPGCVSQGKTKEDEASRGRCLMASLPVISGSEAVTVFERFGWTVARQN